MLFKNIINNYNKVQLAQTIILISILLVGVIFFGLYLNLLKILIVFFSVIIFDIIFSYIFTGNISKIFNLSKINISFGILFFLRTDVIYIYIFTSFISVISKYLFTYKKRHFLNPSNFGVSLSLLLFAPYAYTNPLQWNFYVSQQIYIFFFIIVGILGLIIIQFFLQKNLKFNQLPLVIPFIITHLIVFGIIGPNEIGSYLDFFNISFLIFAFFMLTDPKTTPYYYGNKILFGILVALIYYILSYFTNENFNLLWSLFIATLFLPLIWYFEDKCKKENKCKYTYLPLSVILLVFVTFLFLLYNAYGPLDLQFNDRCVSIICR